jgi:hypothetical protein
MAAVQTEALPAWPQGYSVALHFYYVCRVALSRPADSHSACAFGTRYAQGLRCVVVPG